MARLDPMAGKWTCFFQWLAGEVAGFETFGSASKGGVTKCM
jgi:hypothetical protein